LFTLGVMLVRCGIERLHIQCIKLARLDHNISIFLLLQRNDWLRWPEQMWVKSMHQVNINRVWLRYLRISKVCLKLSSHYVPNGPFSALLSINCVDKTLSSEQLKQVHNLFDCFRYLFCSFGLPLLNMWLSTKVYVWIAKAGWST